MADDAEPKPEAESKPEPKKRAKPKPKGRAQKVSAHEKVQRDSQVVALRAQGLSWRKVAAEVKLTERSCRRIWSDWTKANRHTIQNIDPLDVAIEQLVRLDSDIEQLAEIGANKKEMAAARVGAIRAKGIAMQQQTELLQALDLLPRNLGKLQVELEIRYVIQALMVWAEEFVTGLVAEVREHGEVRDTDDLMADAEDGLQRILRREQALSE